MVRRGDGGRPSATAGVRLQTCSLSESAHSHACPDNAGQHRVFFSSVTCTRLRRHASVARATVAGHQDFPHGIAANARARCCPPSGLVPRRGGHKAGPEHKHDEEKPIVRTASRARNAARGALSDCGLLMTKQVNVTLLLGCTVTCQQAVL